MIEFLRILLIPISLIYQIIIILRNLFYDKGYFKSKEIPIPVISIGNITVGGTGKSPFTIFLAKYFMKKGFKPAIISRGYKGNSNSIEIVFDGKEILSTPDKCGDEPIMIANNLLSINNNFFVLIGKNRVETSNYAIKEFKPDIILLDDAFQHRKIKRNLDICLIDSKEFQEKKIMHLLLLPAGNLRENIINLKRADVMIQNNKFDKKEKIKTLYNYNSNLFSLNYINNGFFNINGDKYEISGHNIIAFAGIARPESFFEELKKTNSKIIEIIHFKDHHNYSNDDIEKIKSKANEETFIVTTEKDFVKIKYFEDFLKYFNVLFMKIELILEDSDKFFKIIDNRILKGIN